MEGVDVVYTWEKYTWVSGRRPLMSKAIGKGEWWLVIGKSQ